MARALLRQGWRSPRKLVRRKWLFDASAAFERGWQSLVVIPGRDDERDGMQIERNSDLFADLAPEIDIDACQLNVFRSLDCRQCVAKI